MINHTIPDYCEKWPDVEVHYLIISTEEYIVCLNTCLDVDWKTSPEYDQRGYLDTVKFNQILNSVALLESRPQHHLNQEKKKCFRRMLGEAVARGLGHDYESADQILIQAEGFLIDRSREKSREWYLVSGGLCSLLFFGLLSLLLIFRIEVKRILGVGDIDLLVAMIGGCLGALISITLRLGESKIEADSGVYLHALEAISRVTTGAVAGALSGVLIKMGFIFPMYTGTENLPFALFSTGFAAGCTERFVTTFISKIENKGDSHE